MEIKLKIQDPNDNTNTPHGTIAFSTDNKYVYLEVEGKRMAVYADDFLKLTYILR